MNQKMYKPPVAVREQLVYIYLAYLYLAEMGQS